LPVLAYGRVRIGGKEKSLSDLESLYEVVFDRVSKEQLYLREKKQGKILLDELKAFLE